MYYCITICSIWNNICICSISTMKRAIASKMSMPWEDPAVTVYLAWIRFIYFEFFKRFSDTVIILISSAELLLVSVPAGRWQRWRSTASIQHPRTDLWHQQGKQPGPPSTGRIHVPSFYHSAGERSCLWGKRHCDCRGCRPTRRQQLAVWRWCLL